MGEFGAGCWKGGGEEEEAEGKEEGGGEEEGKARKRGLVFRWRVTCCFLVGCDGVVGAWGEEVGE